MEEKPPEDLLSPDYDRLGDLCQMDRTVLRLGLFEGKVVGRGVVILNQKSYFR